ncbi:MAG: OsmC family protein [Curvibacter sp.]
MQTPSFKDRQRALRARYQAEPAAARVTDQACTRSADPQDPFHFVVEPMEGSGVHVPVGVHTAVGGVHDAPCPGDIMCAALAACQDSSIRLVAHLLGVELSSLSVRVTAELDVRGALAVEPGVPVGFQSMRCDVHWVPRVGTPPELLDRLREGAERCCVVLQTLRQPPPVRTVFHASALS